jgi:hypothetical protein
MPRGLEAEWLIEAFLCRHAAKVAIQIFSIPAARPGDSLQSRAASQPDSPSTPFSRRL